MSWHSKWALHVSFRSTACYDQVQSLSEVLMRKNRNWSTMWGDIIIPVYSHLIFLNSFPSHNCFFSTHTVEAFNCHSPWFYAIVRECSFSCLCRLLCSIQSWWWAGGNHCADQFSFTLLPCFKVKNQTDSSASALDHCTTEMQVLVSINWRGLALVGLKMHELWGFWLG